MDTKGNPCTEDAIQSIAILLLMSHQDRGQLYPTHQQYDWAKETLRKYISIEWKGR